MTVLKYQTVNVYGALSVVNKARSTKECVWQGFSGLMLILALLPNIADAAESIANNKPDYQIETLAEGLERPYAFAHLPDRDILITEKSGKLRLLKDGKLSSKNITGLNNILVAGQHDGLLDIILHPRFEQNQFLYLSFIHGGRNANATRVIRARYSDEHLHDIVEIFTAYPYKDTPKHPGGHMAFLKDETLLITIGDGFEFREEAQNLDSALGKIVRVTDDGKIPQDNPFVDKSGGRSAIWTYGHRNQLGIIYDAVGDIVYEHENGPQGGDEINVIKSGHNYGWPLATYGLDYSGAHVTPFQEYPGTTQPIVDWTPSIAPAGMAQCRSCLWKEWEGDLFIGMLVGQHVRRVEIENNIAINQEILFSEIGERIRHLRFGPEGALYVLTESQNSRLLRIMSGRRPE